MILNKEVTGSTRPRLIFRTGVRINDAALGARRSAGGAFSELIPGRFGTLLRPTIFGQERALLAGFIHPQLRGVAGVAAAAGLRDLPRSGLLPRDPSAGSQAGAT